VNYNGVRARFLDIESYGALNAVEVVVKARIRVYKKRCGNAL
jgi:hypothetical protein